MLKKVFEALIIDYVKKVRLGTTNEFIVFMWL
jgi:hypothetical protein